MYDQQNILFSNRVALEITDSFVKIVEEILANRGWNPDDISISQHALSSALAESVKDVQAIINRRNHNEISPGKFAGVVTFRISQWNPIHLSGELLEDPTALKLNALVPFALCLKYFLNVNIAHLPENFTEEFHYNLLRRHTNQETLGLAYDMLEYHVTNARIYKPEISYGQGDRGGQTPEHSDRGR